jgi:hypothetical protein
MKSVTYHIKDFFKYIHFEHFHRYADSIYMANQNFGLKIYCNDDKLIGLSELIAICYIIKNLTLNQDFLTDFFSKKDTVFLYYEMTIDKDIFINKSILINKNFSEVEIFNVEKELKEIFKILSKHKGSIKKTYSELFSKQFPIPLTF